MIPRPVRFDIERPAEFRLTDVRGAPRQQGQTINISTGGVLLKTSQKIGVGRKLEVIVRVAGQAPESPDVDLRLLGTAVRTGDGWVAIRVRKHQIMPTGLPGTPPETGNSSGIPAGPAA